jgi:hypothetical protein
MKTGGVELRNGGKQEITIQTLYGLVTIIRSVLKPQKKRCCNQWCGKIRTKETIPLDEYLQIDKLPFKMTKSAMILCGRLEQALSSYKTAELFLREDFGMMITDSLIQDVTNYVGGAVHGEDARRAEETEKNMTEISCETKRKGVFYVMTDGSMVNTRITDGNGSTWREVKLALLFSGEDAKIKTDGKTIEIQKKEYVPFVGDVEEFKRYVFETAVRMGCFEYEKIIVVGDGAAWIRNMAEELFPGCIQILDFYHLAENIYSFGKYIFDNDEKKYTPWAKALIELLRAGGNDEALSRLKEYAEKKYPAGLVNPHTYIENNRERTNYGQYKSSGYYIGSGPIESANKTVVQRRCKQAGMRWNIKNVQSMITLRAKWESGLWNSAVRGFFLNSA